MMIIESKKYLTIIKLGSELLQNRLEFERTNVSNHASTCLEDMAANENDIQTLLTAVNSELISKH